jgi:hypothetical protein
MTALFRRFSQNCEKRLLASSVRMEQLGSHWRDFHEISHYVFFENLPRLFISFKIGQQQQQQQQRVLYMKSNVNFLSYLAQFFLE